MIFRMMITPALATKHYGIDAYQILFKRNDSIFFSHAQGYNYAAFPTKGRLKPDILICLFCALLFCSSPVVFFVHRNGSDLNA